MKECMSRRLSWQTGTRSKQLWRSGGRDDMDAEVADRGCFCHTSRASARRLAEHASHWVYRWSSLPEILSGNPSQMWKEDQWWTWRVWCTQFPNYVGENVQAMQKSSSTDCISKHSWIWKDFTKMIWIQRSPISLLNEKKLSLILAVNSSLLHQDTVPPCALEMHLKHVCLVRLILVYIAPLGMKFLHYHGNTCNVMCCAHVISPLRKKSVLSHIANRCSSL